MPNVLNGRFRAGSPRPLRTFAPVLCIPASAIMQFRRNVYEYSTKKLRHHFRMQSEREQTLATYMLSMIKMKVEAGLDICRSHEMGILLLSIVGGKFWQCQKA